MNITRLIPYLLNKITKNEKEIVQVQENLDNIDLTPYQLKNEKNSANGYLGLDENKKVLSNKFLIPKKKLAFLSDISLSTPYSSIFLSTVSGGGSFANNYNAKIKSGNSTFITAPTLTLLGSATGYVNLFVNREIMNIYAPFKIFCEIKISLLKNSIKQNRLTIGLSAYYANGNWQSSNGLVFSIDPTVNSGNFQYGKVISGIPTLTNTAITISAETLTSFIIEYNKLTEEANFYIDHELIGTLTSVNIPNNTNLREAISFYSGDATETAIRRCSIFSNNIEFDLEG